MIDIENTEWLGHVSIRTDLNSWLTPESNYYYMELGDFYRQRSPNKTFASIQYQDMHTLGIL